MEDKIKISPEAIQCLINAYKNEMEFNNKEGYLLALRKLCH